jgi:HSP20 family molecular chaperone IbpA
MNRLFQGSFSREGLDEALTTTSFAPPVDICEDEHNITLKMEVPGIDEKDIDVRIEGNTVAVQRRAQVGGRGEGGELSSHRAAVRKLQPLVYSTQLRGSESGEHPL